VLAFLISIPIGIIKLSLYKLRGKERKIGVEFIIIFLEAVATILKLFSTGIDLHKAQDISRTRECSLGEALCMRRDSTAYMGLACIHFGQCTPESSLEADIIWKAIARHV
jgi:hypothetical protein